MPRKKRSKSPDSYINNIFSTLPWELIFKILYSLDYQDMAKLAQTSKATRATIHLCPVFDKRIVWNKLDKNTSYYRLQRLFTKRRQTEQELRELDITQLSELICFILATLSIFTSAVIIPESVLRLDTFLQPFTRFAGFIAWTGFTLFRHHCENDSQEHVSEEEKILINRLEKLPHLSLN